MNPRAGSISRIGSEKLLSMLLASVGMTGLYAIGMCEPGPTVVCSISVMVVVACPRVVSNVIWA